MAASSTSREVVGPGAGGFESYIGACMSIISESEIRYEGVCFYLDAQKGIIGLTKAKTLGTEDRIRMDNLKFPPKETSYDTILFHVVQIKDLQVISMPVTNPSTPGLPEDPFVLEPDKNQSSFISPQSANVTAEISSRLSAIFQGIPLSTQSLWSPEFWSSLPFRPMVNRSGFGMQPTYLPARPSVGVIARPKKSSLSPQSQALALPCALTTTTEDASTVFTHGIDHSHHFLSTSTQCSSTKSPVLSMSAEPFYYPAPQQEDKMKSNVSPIGPYNAQSATLSCSLQMLRFSTSELNPNVVLPPLVVENQRSISGLAPVSNFSVRQASEFESAPPFDWERTQELQQQSEKDNIFDSPSGKIMMSEQLTEDTNMKYCAYQGIQNDGGSQGSQRSYPARGSSDHGRGNTGSVGRGRGKMVWIQCNNSLTSG